VPSGTQHELCRALHAEMNALLQAAKYGIRLEGAEIYTTTQPCVLCAKMLINVGIRRIYFDGDYPDELARAMLREAGVDLIAMGESDA
jgi:dCMP deaminase